MRIAALIFALSGLIFFLATFMPPRDRVENPPRVEVRAEQMGKEALLALYFARADGLGLLAEKRRVQLKPGEPRLLAAFEALAKGPETAGAAPLWPRGLPAPRVFAGAGTVYIDLDPAYARLPLGVRAESLLLYGLANTALANSDADEVRILVGGAPRPVLVHLSLIEPFRRRR